jgi:ribosomal protein L12E/L44/L45/RPP1/RPP2
MAKKSKDQLKTLTKLLDRAKAAESGVTALARRAEVSARALSGAVRQLENLLAKQAPAAPAAPAPAAAAKPARRKTKSAAKRTTKTSAPQ